jgi:hypothetical protein
MIRDMRTDWKHWSAAERVVAAIFLGAATFFIGTVYLLQS